jgi:hypothetical protein
MAQVEKRFEALEGALAKLQSQAVPAEAEEEEEGESLADML